MSRTNERVLEQLQAQINGLIEAAETLAEDNNLKFTVNFGDGYTHVRDWENSWTSSY